MNEIAKRLNAYITAHPFDSGDSDCETALNQLYQAYAESHESDPPEIRDGFKELDALLEQLSLDDNNAVWNLCCQLCTAYEHKAFLDDLKYGAHLMQNLKQYAPAISELSAMMWRIRSPFVIISKALHREVLLHTTLFLFYLREIWLPCLL